MALEPYYATDRRVYNGAPCSDMSREWKHTDELEAYLKKLRPGAFATYFPIEGKWDVSDRDNGYRSIIPDLVYGKQEALIEAINILEKDQADGE